MSTRECPQIDKCTCILKNAMERRFTRHHHCRQKKNRLRLPYLEKFCSRLSPSENVILATNLYAEYLALVVRLTTEPLSVETAESKEQSTVKACTGKWEKVV